MRPCPLVRRVSGGWLVLQTPLPDPVLSTSVLLMPVVASLALPAPLVLGPVPASGVVELVVREVLAGDVEGTSPFLGSQIYDPWLLGGSSCGGVRR